MHEWWTERCKALGFPGLSYHDPANDCPVTEIHAQGASMSAMRCTGGPYYNVIPVMYDDTKSGDKCDRYQYMGLQGTGLNNK